MTGFRRDAAKLHMAKPYFILHAPQVRFIEKSSPAAAFFNGTPWGNRTLNCPLGGGRSIQLSYGNIFKIYSIMDLN